MNESPWEDALLERKLKSDLNDLHKTCVAFANSVKPGHVGVILIGESDKGLAQGVDNPDVIQKRIRKICQEDCYPPILFRTQVYEKDNQQCVRVEIDYSGETPHFGGIAWVRRGSQTDKASEMVFQKLIEFRLGKVREIAHWLGKEITVEPYISEQKEYINEGFIRTNGKTIMRQTNQYLNSMASNAKLHLVNNFWVTFEINGEKISIPLDMIILSWDHKNDQLKLIVKP